MGHNKKTIITTGLVAGLGLATIPALAIALGASSNAFATGISGDVQLNTEVSTSIAMKIASPNDANPDCMTQSGVTYGVANRYATSNGAEGSKQVDTFDGTVGGADEVNSNTSCTTLTMTPNTFDSTYSDVTVYTNSPNGYAVSLQAAEPNLVNTTDSTQYIPAGTLTEVDGTGEQAGTKVTPGGQNKWAYKTNNGIITNWTAATTTDSTIKSYDQETSGGDTTRVTYGISAGNNPTGKYATTLTYTATMFDGNNPYVGNIDVSNVENGTVVPASLKIARGQSKTVAVTPSEGYYLASLTCPVGYDCSGYVVGQEYEDSAKTQTVTVKNDSAANTQTVIDIAMAASGPLVCSSNTAVHEVCRNTSTDNTLMIKLRDGHFWTKEKRESVSWTDLNTATCPQGTGRPSAQDFANLLNYYGGYPDSSLGTPYGYRSDSYELSEVTGWGDTVGGIWTTTPNSTYPTSLAYILEFLGTYIRMYNGAGTYNVRPTVCHRS